MLLQDSRFGLLFESVPLDYLIELEYVILKLFE